MPNNDYILRSDALKAILGVSIYDTIEELDGARTIAENTWADGLYDAYKIIEEEVDAADVEPKKKWIPVTERLPEDGTYLITWKNHTAQGVCMAYYGYYQDGLHRSSKPDFYRYDNEWGDVTFDDVTHWMPIPEPPKGEDHEIL